NSRRLVDLLKELRALELAFAVLLATLITLLARLNKASNTFLLKK
ncbi:33038_t:CDS:1, partial [Gigaspora margarita]